MKSVLRSSQSNHCAYLTKADKSSKLNFDHLHSEALLAHDGGPLSNVAVTGTALGTRTHTHGIPGLGMLQSSYPSVESVLSGTREGLDMQ